MRRCAVALPLVIAFGLVLGACKAETTSVTVKLTLDPATCDISTPDQVTLRCAATAGVWLRTGDGAYLDQACVDFGSSGGDANEGDANDDDGSDGDGGQSLAALPTLLEGVTLSTDRTGDVWVEVAVYAEWAVSSGCQAPDDALEQEVAPVVVVSGRSSPAALADTDGVVDIVLRCDAISPQSSAPECLDACTGDEGDCYDGLNAQVCEDERQSCEGECTGDGCGLACDEDYESCLATVPDGLCVGDFESCAAGCEDGDTACVRDCDTDLELCLADACDEAFEECAGECQPSDAVCATFAP
jgi:hypothetical protein